MDEVQSTVQEEENLSQHESQQDSSLTTQYEDQNVSQHESESKIHDSQSEAEHPSQHDSKPESHYESESNILQRSEDEFKQESHESQPNEQQRTEEDLEQKSQQESKHEIQQTKSESELEPQEESEQMSANFSERTSTIESKFVNGSSESLISFPDDIESPILQKSFLKPADDTFMDDESENSDTDETTDGMDVMNILDNDEIEKIIRKSRAAFSGIPDDDLILKLIEKTQIEGESYHEFYGFQLGEEMGEVDYEVPDIDMESILEIQRRKSEAPPKVLGDNMGLEERGGILVQDMLQAQEEISKIEVYVTDEQLLAAEGRTKEESTGEETVPDSLKDDIKKSYAYVDKVRSLLTETDEGLDNLQMSIVIDRGPFYKKYEVVYADYEAELNRNMFLQKRMAEFYRKKKMEHVLKEDDYQYDSEEKYGKRLDAYGQLLEIDAMERQRLTEEISELTRECNTKQQIVDTFFNKMQNTEKEIGIGLISAKTGNHLTDKYVERLLNRQKNQMNMIVEMRLKLIKIRNRVTDIQSKLKDLDYIGEGYHLMQYEELKIENRSYSDKIEERDEEMVRLRQRCQEAIQILAHVKEKSNAVDSDMMEMNDKLCQVKNDYDEVREKLNTLKKTRDNYRLGSSKILESDLLTQPMLLLDMEKAIKEKHKKMKELQNLKKENDEKAEQIRAIRQNIEKFGGDLRKDGGGKKKVVKKAKGK